MPGEMKTILPVHHQGWRRRPIPCGDAKGPPIAAPLESEVQRRLVPGRDRYPSDPRLSVRSKGYIADSRGSIRQNQAPGAARARIFPYQVRSAGLGPQLRCHIRRSSLRVRPNQL